MTKTDKLQELRKTLGKAKLTPFAVKDSLKSANGYAQLLIGAMPADVRSHAFTAVYVVYNTLLAEFEKDLAGIIEGASADE